MEETLGVKAMARSNLYLRQASTPKVPLPYNSTSPIFWRPWEASCEARRLLTFQATLEKEKGLPPSRWQRKLKFEEEGEATFLNTTRTPVSHRRKGWRREGVGVREASCPELRRRRVSNSLHPGVWDGGGNHVYCYGCGTWGNLVPMV